MGAGDGHDRATVPRAGRATVSTTPASIRLHVQRWPGRQGTAVEGIRLLADGREVPQQAGAFTVPLRRQGFQTVELRVGERVCATWTLGTRADLPAPATIAGLHARLNQLGYMAGMEGTDATADLERALLTFEADANLFPEGLTSTIGRDDIERAVRVVIRHEPATALADAVIADAEGTPAEGPARQSVAGGGMVLTYAFRVCRLVLVRFERRPGPLTTSITVGRGTISAPVIDRPYVDDRGYAAAPHTPVVSVMAHETAQEYAVDLVREGLDVEAPLYVVAPSSSVVQVGAAPLSGSPRERVAFTVSSMAAAQLTGRHYSIEVDLEVRLGRLDGPVIHGLRVLVLRRLPVRASVISIQHLQGGTQLDQRDVDQTLARVNRLLEPAGVAIEADPVEFLFDSRFDYSRQRPAPPAGLDAEERRAWEDEHDAALRMITQRHHPDRLNIYVITNHYQLFEARDLRPGGPRSGAAAYGVWKAAFAELYPGRPRAAYILCSLDAFDSSTATPHVLTHELGHVLGLQHVDDTHIRITSWALRRLMFFHVMAPPELPAWHPFDAHADDSGQERLDREHVLATHMLTIKELARERDGEVTRLRTNVGAHYAYDGIRHPAE